MTPFRRPIAQALLAAVAGSVFLTWVSTASGDDIVGSDFNQGRLTIITCAITIAFIQFGLRPAWIGGGLTVAVLGRELLRADDVEGQSAAVGLWVGTLLAVAAAALLVWDLFASIERLPLDAEH